MQKKIVTWLCATVMTVGVLAGCGAKSEGTPAAETNASENAESVESAAADSGQSADGAEEDRKQLVVGFDAEFPPYGYKDDNGEYVGFDLDLAQAVCDMNGWELVKQPIDWDSKDMELSSGTIDCIWNGFTINGREDAYTWSVPYIDNSQVFVVTANSGIAAKADLAGKIVGVQKDSSALAALNDEENAENIELKDSFQEMVEYGDYNTAFMDLESGAIDAVAMDIGVANYQLSSRGDEYVILAEQLSSEQYGIGFLKGNDSLKDVVEASLLKLFEDGTVAKVAEKYGIDTSMICLDK